MSRAPSPSGCLVCIGGKQLLSASARSSDVPQPSSAFKGLRDSESFLRLTPLSWGRRGPDPGSDRASGSPGVCLEPRGRTPQQACFLFLRRGIIITCWDCSPGPPGWDVRSYGDWRIHRGDPGYPGTCRRRRRAHPPGCVRAGLRSLGIPRQSSGPPGLEAAWCAPDPFFPPCASASSCGDVHPPQVQRQVLGVLTILGLLASSVNSSSRGKGCLRLSRVEFGGAGQCATEARPGAGGHADLGRMKPGPPIQKRTERCLEHSRLCLPRDHFLPSTSLQNSNPRRLNLAPVQIYSPGSPNLTYYIKEKPSL